MQKSTVMLGTSAAMRAIEREIAVAAACSAKVLVTGESGVGKELVARSIHERSSRRMTPFVAINCAGLPETLLESELFGHVRGSFTGAYRDKRGWLETAHGGTIFMDEIGEMSLRMQAMLLRFLETGEIQDLTLVLPHEKDIAFGKVSVLAPLGMAVIGLRAGDEYNWEMPSQRRKSFVVLSSRKRELAKTSA